MRPVDRRKFLGIVGGGLAAAALPRTPLFGQHGRQALQRRIERVGLHLHTVRGDLEREFGRTLERVAGIGFGEVEFAGYLENRPAAVRSALAQNGLKAPAAHVPLADFRDNWDKSLDAASMIGHEYLILAWLEPPERTLDGYKRIAELLDRTAEAGRGRGVRVAYRNQAYDHQPVGGQIPYDLLLRSTGSDSVFMELDLYSARKSGVDPVAYFMKHPGRFALVHVSDMGPAPQHALLDVGAGVIDWSATFSRAQVAGIRHFLVGHAAAADPFASIRTSYDYLRALEY